ncbi:pickpocket protein 28-like [Uranotaenia lowii]|uniref:pickpocket protein 28-like n=1 Tax=Uranotaenia lowii TaxID=190385 RepID=UPI00247AB5DA|nr:pickpocket protein 28-like [Uranotaenia lowii]
MARIRFLRALRILWVEYCEENTISAMKYLTMSNQGLMDRGWWGKWVDNPIYISYETQQIPMWQVPFPAVTVCPIVQGKAQYYDIDEAVDRAMHGGKLDREDYNYLGALSHVCPTMSKYFKFGGKYSASTVEMLVDIALDFEQVFIICRWMNTYINCSKLWSQTITDSGVCFTFNSISVENLYRLENLHREFAYSEVSGMSDDWFRETGYTNNVDMQAYPRRQIGTGLRFGLKAFLLSYMFDDSYYCHGAKTGFKLFVHPPDEAPSFDQFYYHVSLRDSISMMIKPQVTATSQSLRSQPYKDRQCLFENERYLRFFRIYNQHNCIQECMVNFTYDLCGCVKFSMPRSADMRECAPSEISCYSGAYIKMYSQQIGKNTSNPCGCLPACGSLSYDVEISNMPLDILSIFRAYGQDNANMSEFVMSQISISIKDKWILPMVRQELMGVGDLVGTLGGLFGLMIGVSALSLLEIVYFCLIRPFRKEKPAPRKRYVIPWRNPYR